MSERYANAQWQEFVDSQKAEAILRYQEEAQQAQAALRKPIALAVGYAPDGAFRAIIITQQSHVTRGKRFKTERGLVAYLRRFYADCGEPRTDEEIRQLLDGTLLLRTERKGDDADRYQVYNRALDVLNYGRYRGEAFGVTVLPLFDSPSFYLCRNAAGRLLHLSRKGGDPSWTKQDVDAAVQAYTQQTGQQPNVIVYQKAGQLYGYRIADEPLVVSDDATMSVVHAIDYLEDDKRLEVEAP